MKRPARQKQGQFVIIAVLIMAVMIISVATLMHRAVTYYKNEPWDEYLTLVGAIELNSRRVVELSLSNYTNTPTPNQMILENNLEKWRTDLLRTYAGRGIIIDYTLTNGTSYDFSSGLTHNWNENSSFSAANATFSLNITSIGLTGYKFTTWAFLNLTILNIDEANRTINVEVRGEDNMLIDNLKKDNFSVPGRNITSANLAYDLFYDTFVYSLRYDEILPNPVTVRVWDQRGICVSAQS